MHSVDKTLIMLVLSGIFIVFVFVGEPDIHDGIINYLYSRD